MGPVNLFFSCDDNYIPFLGVALTSIKDHRDPDRQYILRIVHTGITREHMELLERTYSEENFTLFFRDITPEVRQFADLLHTRDYFSASTYYRLFLPEMYPELDKALYLDSDLVVREDIAKLYDTDLGTNLVGAVPDTFVGGIQELRQYVINRLGIDDVSTYFNAGILLMNFAEMRKADFQQIFLELLESVTFQVAQDQDYLNAICQGRITYIPAEWNAMPRGVAVKEPKLVHYNVDTKPWHCDDVLHGDCFWDCARRSPFYARIKAIRRSYTEADTEKSRKETVALIAMAGRQAEAEAENHHIRKTIAKVVGL